MPASASHIRAVFPLPCQPVHLTTEQRSCRRASQCISYPSSVPVAVPASASHIRTAFLSPCQPVHLTSEQCSGCRASQCISHPSSIPVAVPASASHIRAVFRLPCQPVQLTAEQQNSLMWSSIEEIHCSSLSIYMHQYVGIVNFVYGEISLVFPRC